MPETTDRAKELIARARDIAAAFRSRWGAKDEPGTTSHTLDSLATLAEQAIARADAARRILQTWDTPTDMDLETLAKAIKARVAELEEINVQNKNQIAELLEEMDDRAEKAEDDRAEARRMLKEADNQIAWDHAARGVTVKFPGTHIALEAIARHRAALAPVQTFCVACGTDVEKPYAGLRTCQYPSSVAPPEKCLLNGRHQAREGR